MTETIAAKIENRLIATHVSDNLDFEEACMNNNYVRIIQIFDEEMEENNLFTKGAIKLKDEIKLMIAKNKPGTDIMFKVWNARLSGAGFGVIA
jgi:hypothetical protein